MRIMKSKLKLWDGGHHLSIEETEKLIEFLTIQLENKKEINKVS